MISSTNGCALARQSPIKASSSRAMTHREIVGGRRALSLPERRDFFTRLPTYLLHVADRAAGWARIVLRESREASGAKINPTPAGDRPRASLCWKACACRGRVPTDPEGGPASPWGAPPAGPRRLPERRPKHGP